jgi:hypothetical protein
MSKQIVKKGGSKPAKGRSASTALAKEPVGELGLLKDVARDAATIEA